VAVEVLAGTVVPHCCAGICVPRGDLHVPQVDPGVEHGGHEGVPEHVGVHPREADASDGCELAQSPGCDVPVHPGAASVEQERSTGAIAGRPLDGAADRGRQRHQDDFAALVRHPQDPVPVLFAEVVDVCSDSLEDPQAEQA
jgi:hypothetical protein